MRLWIRITIAISILSIITAISLSVFFNKQFKSNLDKVNFELSEALTSSISQSILDYVIDGNVRKTQEVLRRIAKENSEIDYIVVIDFNDKLFATSVDVAQLPAELRNKDHLNCKITSYGKGEDDSYKNKEFIYDSHKVYDYSHPFVKDLSAHIHFGLKNSLYTQSNEEINQYSLFIILIISIIGTIIGYILGKKINQPLQKLSNELSNFGKEGKSDLDGIKTTDKDIIALIESFKAMIRKRKMYESEIAEYKTSLKIQVKERTKELELEIVNHKQTEEKLLVEKDLSDKANSAKSDFLSHMSHELRTPLNAVLGFSQLLELEESETVQEYTKEILKAGYHLLALINDILDLSKIEAGELELSVENVSWNAVLDECYVLVEVLQQDKNISVSSDYDDNSNYIVNVDRVRLKQVCLNLISNAIKYNQHLGTVIVSFSISNNILRMSVKDSGNGIEKNKQKKLFSPFQRFDIDKGAIDGVGIGLVITKSLVENMHGEIGFKSEYGLGSVFWVEFPLERIEENTDLHVSEAVQQEHLNVINKHKKLPFNGIKKILYVEDNPSNMKVVDNIFKNYSNVEIYPAYSPSEGFNILKSKNIDLILLDINLPEMDGYKFKEILDGTSEYKNIKVVGISANAMTHDIEKASQAGFVDYISKPINVNKLIETIIDVFSQK